MKGLLSITWTPDSWTNKNIESHADEHKHNEHMLKQHFSSSAGR